MDRLKGGRLHTAGRTAWWIAVFLCPILLLAQESVRAALLESPKRVVEERTVDLTPLFRWWTNHQGARPLTGWVRVTGTVAKTNSLGWVISGQAEKIRNLSAGTAPVTGQGEPSEFLLKNPPMEEAGRFAELQAQLKDAKTKRERLQQDQTNAKTQETAVRNGTRGRVRAGATRQLHAVEKADADAIKQLDRTITQLQKKLAVYPSADHYELNSFALDTGTEYNRLRVYDRGLPFK